MERFPNEGRYVSILRETTNKAGKSVTYRLKLWRGLMKKDQHIDGVAEVNPSTNQCKDDSVNHVMGE